jgi:hypothetical protein
MQRKISRNDNDEKIKNERVITILNVWKIIIKRNNSEIQMRMEEDGFIFIGKGEKN